MRASKKCPDGLQLYARTEGAIPETIKPVRRSVDKPTPTAQMFLAYNVVHGDPWMDALGVQPLPVAGRQPLSACSLVGL